MHNFCLKLDSGHNKLVVGHARSGSFTLKMKIAWEFRHKNSSPLCGKSGKSEKQLPSTDCRPTDKQQLRLDVPSSSESNDLLESSDKI